MYKSILIFIFIAVNYLSYGQTIIGRVIDENEGTAIPFVSIGIVGANQSTISNENGDFIFKNIKLPCKIRYSHVSYITVEQTIDVENKDLLIKLKPASINLLEVKIDPLLGQRLITKAIKKALLYQDKFSYSNAFYRQLTTLNNKASQIYELFYDLKSNPSGIIGWNAKESRFAELNEGFNFSISNQSYLTFSLASYIFETKKNGIFISLNNFKKYDCTVVKYIEQPDQNIAVITCKYKGNMKKFYINSTFYIGTEDNCIYKIDNSIFNLPMKFTGSVQVNPPILTSTTTFNRRSNEIPEIESVSTKLYLNLSIVRKGNLKPLITSLLSVYDIYSEDKNHKFNKITKHVRDKEVIESITYNPEFWNNNPIVKQTALEDAFIKMMDNKSAFGTMIKEN